MVSSVLEKTATSVKDSALILWFEEVGTHDVGLVGGKNSSLGEMIQQLTPKGVNVPSGFATTAHAYRYFVKEAGLEAKLRELFTGLDVNNMTNLQERGHLARQLILDTPFPQDLQDAITQAYSQMCDHYGCNISCAG